MRVLHIVQGLAVGGIECLVVSMLSAEDHDGIILSIDHTPEAVFRAWPALEKYRSKLFFANKQKGFRPNVVTFVRKLCKEHSVSVIHTHHIGALIYGSLATLSLKKIGHIHTEHDVWHLRQYKHRFIQAILFKIKKNIFLVAVSQSVLDGLKNCFPGKAVSLVHNAVDTTRFRPGDREVARMHFNLPVSAVIIGSAGRLQDVKGHCFLISAMKKLPDNFYLAIAGKGSLQQQLLAQIQGMNLTDRVVLLDFVENMPLFYQTCDLFCLPSLEEGFPLALLEAQSCNIPVISSNAGGCREAVDPHSGVLVPVANSDAIAEASLSVYPKKRNPREFIIHNFSLSVLVERYTELYRRALK